MLRYYEDIISKLGEPQWWDEHGVPRYCPFAPDQAADIYARQVALMEIACQNCGRRFRVAVSYGTLAMMRKLPTLSAQFLDRSLEYGDPPNIRCCPAGPTMSSVPLRVLEFWERGLPDHFEFARNRQFEGRLDADWAEGWNDRKAKEREA